jgi:hypothetical protein
VASGLGGLIGVGRTQKEQALAGLTRSAQLEAQKDIMNQQLKAQKEAAVMNLAGTAGGITGAYLLSQPATSAATMSAVPGGAAAVQAAANPTATALGISGGGTAAGGTAGAALTGQAGAGAGAGATGTMAAAAPWVALAIAGVYVLKKLFD